MASRKDINFYTLEYFIVVRNCIHFFVFYGYEVRFY